MWKKNNINKESQFHQDEIANFFRYFFSRNSKMAILGIKVRYSKVVKSKKSWEIEFIIKLLWFCVVDAGLVDSWNNLREILDERWLGDLSPKFPEEILRLYIFRNVNSKHIKLSFQAKMGSQASS